MLVLTRKVGEKIVIGKNGIEIEVNKIRGGRVSLTIKAPEDMPIVRGELIETNNVRGGEDRDV